LSDITEKTEDEQEQEQRERVRLDEIVKLLFNVSKPMLIATVNGLFNTTYDPDSADVEVIKTATEYVKNDMKVIRSDLFLQITANGKSTDYHVEFQISADSRMVIRLFEYDIQHAMDKLRLTDTVEIPRLRLSQSLVIHFEKGGNIPDKYRMIIEYADGTEHEYTAEVFKYWDYDSTMLIGKKLYNLLPLQLFILRAELDKLTKDKSAESKQKAATKVISLTENLANTLMGLYDDKAFDVNDLDKIISSLNELLAHLRDRYGIAEELSKGVENMIKTLYDERLVKRVKEETKEEERLETAKTLLEMGDSVEKVAKVSKLSVDDIEKLKKNLKL